MNKTSFTNVCKTANLETALFPLIGCTPDSVACEEDCRCLPSASTVHINTYQEIFVVCLNY